MPCIFIDDSIQERLGFIVVSYVVSETELEPLIQQALTRAGLRPYQDEFKSSLKMKDQEHLRLLRDELRGIILQHTRIGALILPLHERPKQGELAMLHLHKLALANQLDLNSYDVYLDDGFSLPDTMNSLRVHPESNSITVLGIQLADLAAHYVSTLIAERIAGARKTLNLEREVGLPDLVADLGWLINFNLRHNFFLGEALAEEGSPGDGAFWRKLIGYGMFLSEGLPPQLADEIGRQFDYQWLGCVI